MQPREQIMVGGLLLVVGAYITPTMVVGPMMAELDGHHQAIAENEAKVPALTAANTRLTAKIARLKKLETVPSGVNIRKKGAAGNQAAIKAMLDDLVTLANHYKNELITLTPFSLSDDPSGRPPQAATNNAAAPPEPTANEAVPTTQSFGYVFTLRGTYAAIEKYINVLSTHPDLLEIQQITYENEGGQHREQLTLGTLPTNKPIRAQLRLVLYLQ